MVPFKSAVVLARGDGGGPRLVFATARITDGPMCASAMAAVSGKAAGG